MVPAKEAPKDGDADTCAWCARAMSYSSEDGWIDPEAPATPEDGDDHIWRETCDENPDFDARHEPGTVVVRVTFKCTKCEHRQTLRVVSPVVDRGTDQLTGGFTGSAADFCDECDGEVVQDGDGEIVVERLEARDVSLYEVTFVGVR